MSFVDKIIAQLPFAKKSSTTRYFFTLNIGLSQLSVAVWSISEHKLEILGHESVACLLPSEDARGNNILADEELFGKVRTVLDRVLSDMDVEPEQILFGVPDIWTKNDDLGEPYLKLLRKLVKKYDLEPMAYVTTTHAMSRLIQSREGVPPTVILLGIGEFIEVTLLRGGKVLDSKVAKRPTQLFNEVEKLLEEFTEVEVLPSKILLYPTSVNEDLAEVRDDLMSYPWMQRLPFLHFPKIETLSEDVAISAVTFAGASEIDPEVSFKYNVPFLSAEKESKRLPQRLGRLDSPEQKISQSMVEGEEAEVERKIGFARGDIRQRAKAEESDFSPGQREDLDEEISPVMKEELEDGKLLAVEEDNVETESPSRQLTIGLSGLANQFTSKASFVGRARLSGLMKTPLVFILIALTILLASYVIFVKATVTIFIEPRILEKNAQVVADPQLSTVDEEKRVIPATIVETTVSGSGKAAASGQKEIGDPARGQILIYNKTESPKSLSGGTTLLGPNNLRFTLDSPVTVASASAVEGGIAFGKTKASITAVAIGPDSNLPAGTDLSLTQTSTSSLSAKVDQSLSGGTSKTVTVVTSDDQKKLQAQLLDDLRQKAQEQLKSGLPPGKKIIPEALTVKDGKYNFNKRINDVAGEFSLSATVRFQGTAYTDTDLRTIVSKLVETNVPDGFVLNLADTETQADIIKAEKDGKLIFQAKFRAKLLPKLDIVEFKKKIRGKSVDSVIDYVKQMENAIGSEIKFTPSLPAKFARMPLLDRNITVIVTPK